MKQLQRMSALLAIALLAACSTGRRVGEIESAAGGVMRVLSPGRETALRLSMRDLWSDHVVWTRDYIIAATSGAPDAPVALNRLMKNQEDIGAAIAPYYGAAAGSRLSSLLKAHIAVAGEVVAAAKAGNTTRLKDADRRWHDNAQEIATFLSRANSNWSESDLKAMLDNHLALTTQEATARLHKSWSEDQQTFDEVYDQAMSMADALTDGIVKQFPGGPP